MQKPDLIKLAPTLSAEERYKLIVTDFQRERIGEKPMISESERKVILDFKDRGVWEEYTRRVLLYQWIDVLWTREIETEKLRMFACYLILSHSFERLYIDIDEGVSKKKKLERFEQLKNYTALFGTQSEEFYLYREAILKIKQELYDMPVFDQKVANRIEGYFKDIDELINRYNNMIRDICKISVIKQQIKPIVQDQGNYLIKKVVPSKEKIDEAINALKQVVESELRAFW